MTRENPPRPSKHLSNRAVATGEQEPPPSNPKRLTRRSFIGQLGAAGLAATAAPMLPAYAREAPTAPSPPVGVKGSTGPGVMSVTLRVNGKRTHCA
jgi:xanthine dehydrogenase YagT iron-sulfur-binding subunit